MKEEYLTQEKFDELTKELDHLKRVRRREVAESLEYAKSLGDLSENAEYHEARDMQAAIEDRIAHLEQILKTSKIIAVHQKADAVTVGSVITIKNEKSGSEQTYTIVGAEEADISSGKISTKSPLGANALGKKKGDKFSFSTPSGEANYKVIEIK
jgi:transcription elongation factor GreA